MGAAIIGGLLGLGGSAYAASRSSSAQRDAAAAASDATLQATREQLDFARENRDIGLGLAQPYQQAGGAALAAMMDMLGLQRTATSSPGLTAPNMRVPQAPPGALVGSTGDGSFDPSSRDFEISTGGLGRRLQVDTPTAPPGVNTSDLSSYPQFNFQADPGYQFRLSEGIRAMDASASARGQLHSGGMLRELMTYGQDMASQEYMNVFNRLGALAGFGSTGTTQAGQATSLYSQLGSNAIGQAGASRASAFVGAGNATSNFWGQMGSALGGFNWGSLFNSGRSAAPQNGVMINGGLYA